MKERKGWNERRGERERERERERRKKEREKINKGN